MNANEKIVVESYTADTVKDDYERGEVGGCVSSWGNNEIKVDGRFDSVSDALKKVCEVNGLTFDKDGWCNWFKESGEEAGRFYSDFTVDDTDSEATDSEIEQWKCGKKALYNLHINVYLKVVAERNLTESEMDI